MEIAVDNLVISWYSIGIGSKKATKKKRNKKMTVEEKLNALNSDNVKIVEIFVDALFNAQSQTQEPQK